MDYQVVIVGGGPAAHNAALALGRARKRVLMCDEGIPRNRAARHSHTFFTRDGTPPLELRRIAIEQLGTYDTVSFLTDKVTDIEKQPDGFRVSFAAREAVTARLILLAVGMVDRHLDVPGFEELWGETVIHCPYCHGWEVRDLPWAFYMTRPEPFAVLARLRYFSSDVMAIVENGVSLPPETQQQLKELGYAVAQGTIATLHAENGRLASIELQDGQRIRRQVLLYSPPQQQTPLVQQLGLTLDGDGYVVTDETGQTSLPGVYAAGDLSSPRQQIAIAAANGVMTAIAMDTVLAASTNADQ